MTTTDGDSAVPRATITLPGLCGLACLVLLPLLVVGPAAAPAAGATSAPAAFFVAAGTSAPTGIPVRAPAQTLPDPAGAGPAGTLLTRRDTSSPAETVAPDQRGPAHWKVLEGLLTLAVLVLAALGLGRSRRRPRPGAPQD